MASRNNHHSAPILNVVRLEKRFGGITALTDYSVKIHQGELVGLIGPNGAGKTTVFNLLSSVLRPTGGRIYFNNRDITRLRSDQSTALGIARTFQNIRLFKELTVLDNIKVAFHIRLGRGLWNTLFHTSAYRRAEVDMQQRSNEIMALFDLTSVKDTLAKALPYGIQRRVEIARAMATLPKLLLLDEPSAGLNPSETDELVKILRNIHRKNDLTIFLVEHDMKLIMAVCQKIQVIDRGRMLTKNKPPIERDYRRICGIFPILGERAGQTAGSLSGGEQEMLAVGRALMSRPRLLILDEPSLVLGPIIIENLFQVLHDINAEGMTILLVEQNAVMALENSHRAYALENGRV